MKNKNAFTLVELLAVIAILAILVIIALPNVIKLFNEAKKNTFLTETRTIYKEAQKKYINESVKGNTIRNISSTGDNKLDITGEQLDYCITLSAQGEITSMKVSNGKYYIEYDNGKIEDLNIEDVKDGEINTLTCKARIVAPVNECVSGKELLNGVTYENGQYTYTYNDTSNGWSVKLTDPNSTNPVATKLCTIIDNKPIVSMTAMFYGSQATSVDLSSFDTSKVTNMNNMFSQSKITTITGLNKIDTSNVIDMSYMFRNSVATDLDVSSFDTSNVTNMDCMFSYSKVEILDLSSFDTSKVTNMNNMFSNTNVTTIYASNKWDTSNVVQSYYMFYAATKLVGNSGIRFIFEFEETWDKTYARVDGGTSNPGYFTYKASN